MDGSQSTIIKGYINEPFSGDVDPRLPNSASVENKPLEHSEEVEMEPPAQLDNEGFQTVGKGSAKSKSKSRKSKGKPKPKGEKQLSVDDYTPNQLYSDVYQGKNI